MQKGLWNNNSSKINFLYHAALLFYATSVFRRTFNSQTATVKQFNQTLKCQVVFSALL